MRLVLPRRSSVHAWYRYCQAKGRGIRCIYFISWVLSCPDKNYAKLVPVRPVPGHTPWHHRILTPPKLGSYLQQPSLTKMPASASPTLATLFICCRANSPSSPAEIASFCTPSSLRIQTRAGDDHILSFGLSLIYRAKIFQDRSVALRMRLFSGISRAIPVFSALLQISTSPISLAIIILTDPYHQGGEIISMSSVIWVSIRNRHR